MEQPYKPQGYSSVSAYVVAQGAQRVIDFLTQAFDAKQTRRFDMPDGSIMHAEVQIDDTVVMIADGGGKSPAFPGLAPCLCARRGCYLSARPAPRVESPLMSQTKRRAIPTVVQV